MNALFLNLLLSAALLAPTHGKCENLSYIPIYDTETTILCTSTYGCNKYDLINRVTPDMKVQRVSLEKTTLSIPSDNDYLESKLLIIK